MGGKMNKLLTAVLVLTVVALVGCAAHDAARSDRKEPNQIVDISIDNDSDSLNLKIQTIQSLIYTEHRIAKPRGIVFSFPDTKIGGVKGLYKTPGKKIIRYIRADAHAVNGSPVATVYIALKADAPYEVTRHDAMLQVTFPRRPGRSDKIASRAKPTAVKAEPPVVQKVPPTAVKREPPRVKRVPPTAVKREPPRVKRVPPTAVKPEPSRVKKVPPTAAVLKSVIAKTHEDALAVNIVADGSITKYKAFTIEKPARIVFDIFKIETPYFKEKMIRVQSKVARQIRYCGHPDKMRLVIDTRKEFLSKYSSTSTDTGLMITVGEFQK